MVASFQEFSNLYSHIPKIQSSLQILTTSLCKGHRNAILVYL